MCVPVTESGQGLIQNAVSTSCMFNNEHSTVSNTRVCVSNGEWTGADPECSEYIMYV